MLNTEKTSALFQELTSLRDDLQQSIKAVQTIQSVHMKMERIEDFNKALDRFVNLEETIVKVNESSEKAIENINTAGVKAIEKFLKETKFPMLKTISKFACYGIVFCILAGLVGGFTYAYYNSEQLFMADKRQQKIQAMIEESTALMDKFARDTTLLKTLRKRGVEISYEQILAPPRIIAHQGEAKNGMMGIWLKPYPEN